LIYVKKVRNEKSFSASSAKFSYAAKMRELPGLGLICLLLLTACSSEIYVRDGVTDGDTFYLAQRALIDDDAALQSWVSYSLTRSTCQLQIGGANPARASSFECELTARRLLLETWTDKQIINPLLADEYLDELVLIQRAGFLDEYVARNFRKAHWQLPDDIDIPAYREWRQDHVPAHKPVTRIVGSWNYASNVTSR
jgi:hypothetical protein